MSVFTDICIGLSAGIVLGFAAGGLKALFHHSPYSARRVEAVRRMVGRAATLLKYITFMLLSLGLVWCTYFLVLGILDLRIKGKPGKRLKKTKAIRLSSGTHWPKKDGHALFADISIVIMNSAVFSATPL